MRQSAVALVLSLATGTAWAQTEKEWAAALAIWQKQSGSQKPDERAEAARAIGNATYKEKDLTCLQYLVGLLTQELGREGNGGKFEERVSGLVLEECVTGLRRLTDERAIDQLIKHAKNRNAGWRFRFYIIRALAGISSDKGVKTIRDILEDPKDDPHVHIACADALAEKADKATLPTLHKVIKDDTRPWEVRVSALEAIKKCKDEASIPELIEALAKIKEHEGRLKADVITTLKKMTSIELDSEDPNDWKAAWEAKKAGKDPAKEGGTGVVPTKFFGLKTRSTRIVFVLDKSGSMMEPGSEPTEPEEPEKPKIGTADGPRPKGPTDPNDPKRELSPAENQAYEQAKKIYEEWKSKNCTTKIDILKKNFIKTLFQMDWRVWFGIVWFDSSVQTWKDEMVQATWPNKLEAIKHVAGLQPVGMTNLWDGLETAFKIASKPTPKDPGAAKVDKNAGYIQVLNGPDTFYVMTDGIPNFGRVNNEPGILEELRKVNQVRKIIIHGIVMGDPPDVHPDFMQKLAQQNGGEFKHIKK